MVSSPESPVEANPPKTHLNESVISLNSYFCFPRAMLIFAYLGPRMMRSQTTTEFRGCESETGREWGATRGLAQEGDRRISESSSRQQGTQSPALCSNGREERDLRGHTHVSVAGHVGQAHRGPGPSRVRTCDDVKVGEDVLASPAPVVARPRHLPAAARRSAPPRSPRLVTENGLRTRSGSTLSSSQGRVWSG